MGNINGAMSDERITCEEYNEIRKANIPHVLIDVRPRASFEKGALDNAINIPRAELEDNIEKIKNLLKEKAEEVNQNEVPLYLICRSSFNSSQSVPILRKYGIKCKDIIGGLLRWKKVIDPDFPI